MARRTGGSGFDPRLIVSQLAPFAGAPRCWVAFSGGLDSQVLLAAAAAVRDRLPGVLHAIHLDHGLHPDSAAWAQRCRCRCRSLSVPFIVRRLGLGPRRGESLEALARAARYRAFAEILDPGELLLTAHNQDDQAETLLLALLRGSGVRGLAAMPFVAPLGAGYLVRPLLGTTRAALADYACAQSLDWIEDPSNRETAFDRNYLRHRVMPVLRERWPALSATFSRSASHCAEATDLGGQLAAQTLARLAGERPGTLDVAALKGLGRPLLKSVLRLWLDRAGFRPPDARHLDRVIDEALVARRDSSPLVAWSGCEVRRYRRNLFALAPLPDPPSPGICIDWPDGGEKGRVELPRGLGTLERCAALEGPLRVRFGQSGLSCRSARAGCSRTLKNLFQKSGIPAWLRPYVPLVFGDDGLIAVAGVCACDARVPMHVLRWRGHPWEALGLFNPCAGEVSAITSAEGAGD